MIVYLHTSKMSCIIYRLDFHNLQTRKVWNGTNSTNRTLHEQQYCKVSNKLMLTLLDISDKDSIHTIYWLAKWLKKFLEQFNNQIKKAKRVLVSWRWTSTKDNIKALKYKSCLSFCACQKKNCWIYWLNQYNLLTNKYS